MGLASMGRYGAAVKTSQGLDHPGNVGGSDSWEDAESWWHRRSIQWTAFSDPAVVHGMCEDYRAGLHTDRAGEEADRAAGRKIQCPVLLLAAALLDFLQ
jgi:hypothetical protein